MEFCHLQIKSAYSMLKSNIDIEKMVQKAKESGFQSLALTDVNTMHGAINFYQACVKQEIQPILGLSISLDVKGFKEEVVLLARNMSGYQQLVQLSSRMQLESIHELELEDFLSCLKADALVIILPIWNVQAKKAFLDQTEKYPISPYRQMKERLKEVYIGLFHEDQIESCGLIDPSLSSDLVAINDVRFLEKGEHDVLPFLQAIGEGSRIDDSAAYDDLQRHYLQTEEEMGSKFIQHSNCIKRTKQIADLCQLALKLPLVSLPEYPLPPQIAAHATQKDYLTQLCIKGVEKRYAHIKKEIYNRLHHELSVIYKMHFENYFLIVWDFMKYARTHGILTGPGRGSAAGSLVAYVLGITDVDPIKYGLLFERFLNPERITMPDIDLDFPDHKRDEMIQYVKDKYGTDYIAHIVTFGTFGAKQAVRDIGRVMGYTPKELDEFSKRIPSRLNITLAEAYDQSEAFRKIIDQTKRSQQLLHYAQKIEGLPRHTSIHAAGIIISPVAFGKVVPVSWGPDQTLVTQYPANALEELGFLKMDFLGLRNLKLIQEILWRIKKYKGIALDIRRIPLDDAKTYEIFQRGETNGVFQFESQGMRRALRDLQPTEFNDLVALNALYRPGPMEQIPTYIANKRKQIRDDLQIDALRPILSDTYGIIVYQEQIMQIASVMAGFSLADADLLRRAISKKKKEVLDFERTRFIKGTKSKGYDEEIGNKVYDLIVQFANYGFNKSHSVAYSMIAYQLAYLKANYPTEFFVAALSNVMGSEEKTQTYLKEASASGLSIFPPSVLKGQFRFSNQEKGILLGLGNIKGIGRQIANQLLEERKKQPFIDFFDFVSRMSICGYGQKTFETLILAGAMDDFGIDRGILMHNLDSALRYTELIQPFMQGNQMNLFDLKQMVPKPKLDMSNKMSEEEKGTYEKEFLGFYLTVDPFKKFKKFSFDGRFILLKELQYTTKYLKRFVSVMVQSIRVIKTKKGDQMAFLMLTDSSGTFEAVVFPKVFSKIFLQLRTGSFIVLQCGVDFSREKLQYIVHECWPIEMFEQSYIQGDFRLYVQVEQSELLNFQERAHEVLTKYPGRTEVVFYEKKDQQMSNLLSGSIVLNDESIEVLIGYFTEKSLVIKK